MNARFYVGTVALFGALALPCAGNLRPDSLSLSDTRQAQKLAAKAKELQALNAKCEALKSKAVVFEEERAIGGAVALSFVNRSEKHVLIDLPPGATLNSLKDPKAVKIPKGAKRDLNQYVNLVGQNLAAFSTRPTLAWTFAVLDDPNPNAYSAPGGYVLITRGLLQKLDNEAQLAGVLAHEIGHVTERHALNLYRDVKVTQCRTAVGAEAASMLGEALELKKAFGGLLDSEVGFLDLDNLSGKAITQIADAAIDKIQSGFASDDEFESDTIAIELIVAAGYNPREYGKLIAKLPDSKGMLANHPKNADRLSKIEDRIKAFQPQEGGFGNFDYPFTKYPVVAFKGELSAAK